MHVQVTLQSSGVREPEPADLASEGLFAGVGSHVNSQVSRLSESLVTHAATERLVANVDRRQVTTHARAVSKLLRTLRTGNPSLVRVNQEMFSQS